MVAYERVVRDSLELASLASSPPTSRASSPARKSSSSSPRGSLDALVRDEDPLAPSNSEGRLLGRHGRSDSVSSAFDFTSTLFPLSATADGGYARLGVPPTLLTDREGGFSQDASLERRKTLTYLNGLSLVISCIIGSGIFSSPGRVVAGVGSPGAAILVWISAGILAWTGAASYAELGGTIPLNGGAQVYLAKIFGEAVGFSFTWCAVLVLKPGSQSIIATILGEYVLSAVRGGNTDISTISPWISKGVAIAILFVVILLNCMSTRLSTRVTDAFMFFKFIALMGVLVIGVIVAATGYSHDGKPNTEWRSTNWFAGTSHDPSRWAVALYAGLWAYEGWDNMSYAIGEFKNPGRDLSRVIHTAMPIVVLLFVVANVSYFFVLPTSVIKATNTVGVQFGLKALGTVGAIVLAFIVSGSCFGSLNASMFTLGRLVHAAGREGYVPAIFGRLGLRETAPEAMHTQRSRSRAYQASLRIFGDDVGFGYTPVYALLLNGIITSTYTIIGDFPTLVTFYGVAGYFYYFLTVLGLIVLRIREPNLERPYKTWITTPITFCCVSLFLLSRTVIAQPLQTLIVMAFIAMAVPVYFWRISVRDGDSVWQKVTSGGLCGLRGRGRHP
ncbi:hypothetical protein KEM52_006165 [Ascosphaera acerosa]|nr:hypothetical protein KEM52_006165 [Ascosphaera acerosa]